MLELRGTYNAGYEIKESVYFTENGIGYVIASRYSELLQREQYATWAWDIQTDGKAKTISYFWGHYFDSKSTARIDFYERITREAERLEDFWKEYQSVQEHI